METFLKITLVVHIICGFLALTTGCISISVKKGGKIHRFSGKIFFYSMIVVTASAFVISLVKNNMFLLLIAVFSFYNNYMGFRAIKNKSLKPSTLDWIVLVFGSVNTFFMIYSMNIVLMVFGGISIFVVVTMLRNFLRTRRGEVLPVLSWLKVHIGMMMGAYTATITAFIVVNSNAFEFLPFPSWLPWLLPAAILSPLSFYFTKKYTGKSPKKTVLG